jgi:hypothetical protein
LVDSFGIYACEASEARTYPIGHLWGVDEGIVSEHEIGGEDAAIGGVTGRAWDILDASDDAREETLDAVSIHNEVGIDALTGGGGKAEPLKAELKPQLSDRAGPSHP